MTEPIDTDSRPPADIEVPDIEIPGEPELPEEEDVTEDAGSVEPPD
ncbi:hypothetical protein ACVGVM_14535 [Pseudonocardia bannensis]|uniref:Uncharacterized protein n=1 Tax=Pseudonocardia bannensis TaxID=630973 RepID=A0A848DR44_9PSEU|nr:hypothetical protein [Pseudonocardia bannensis]NMH94861.1 hypothetical protein [Pseudonocardia bannensis]